jgi:DNA-3-methyladenine glycosylase II
MRRIVTLDDVAEGLDALARLDPRLRAVRKAAGEVPLRRTEPGFASLVSVVVSQQVSRASADAIMGRLTKLVEPLTPENFVAAGEAAWREAGLSRGKMRALVAIGEALASGSLDLDTAAGLEAVDAIRHMTAVHGIGPWTAEVYLLVAAGHPDIFRPRTWRCRARWARRSASTRGRPTGNSRKSPNHGPLGGAWRHASSGPTTAAVADARLRRHRNPRKNRRIQLFLIASRPLNPLHNAVITCLQYPRRLLRGPGRH